MAEFQERDEYINIGEYKFLYLQNDEREWVRKENNVVINSLVGKFYHHTTSVTTHKRYVSFIQVYLSYLFITCGECNFFSNQEEIYLQNYT